jgi:hypothetical protein
LKTITSNVFIELNHVNPLYKTKTSLNSITTNSGFS